MTKWFHFSCARDEDHVNGAFFADEDDFHGVDWMVLKMGRPQTDWDPQSWFRASEKRCEGVLEDVLNTSTSLPVFSRRLKDALDAAAIAVGDVQYLPVRVIHYNGREAGQHFIANVLARVEALDRPNCVRLEEDPYEIIPATGKPRIKGIWGPITVFESPLEGHDFVRLLEYFPEMLVSSRFTSVFEEGGFTGARFAPIASR